MRYRIGRGASKRKFAATSGNTRAINIFPRVMRGGYRM